MEKSYQFYAPAALFPDKEAHIPINPVSLGSVAVYTHLRRGKFSCPCLVSKLTQFFSHSDKMIALQTQLSCQEMYRHSVVQS
jgi:predicted GNAT family N-acyltransferase